MEFGEAPCDGRLNARFPKKPTVKVPVILPTKSLRPMFLALAVVLVSAPAVVADCPRGKRQTPSGCVAVEIPKNAELDVYGDGWKCKRGYKVVASECTPMSPEELREYDRASRT